MLAKLIALSAAAAAAVPMASALTFDADKLNSRDMIKSLNERNATLPGLGDTQTNNAQGIVQQIKDDSVGHQGCLAGFATALVESSVYIYANEAVPESLNYHYDKIGSDYDSVGIFQQRAIYYPDIAADMDPAGSAHQFFEKMVAIDGWETMDVGDLCQEVQGSAYPDRYSERVGDAEAICSAAGI